MASARRPGTNENVSTYDSGGGKDYTALATWESATDNDLVSATQSEVVEIYAGAHDDSGMLLDGATTDASYFRIIRAADGEGHSGIVKTDGTVAALVTTTLSTRQLWTKDNYNGVYDIVFDAAGNTADQLYNWEIGSTGVNNYNKIVGCLFNRVTNAGAGATFNIRTRDLNYYVNCLFKDADDDGFRALHTPYTYNCTENGSGTVGTQIVLGSTLVSKNCVWDSGVTETGTYTATTDTTDTPTYVDSGSGDFHLSSGDSVCIDNGTDLSSDGTYAFDDDIDGETRSGTWDIGMDEYAVTDITGSGAGTLTHAGAYSRGLKAGREYGGVL